MNGPRAGDPAGREAAGNAARRQAAHNAATRGEANGNAAREAGGGAVGDAARAVRAYYRALDRRAYATAWQSLSPAVRASFGSYESWRAGFASTLSSRPGRLAITASGDRATVTHTLVARDQADCGVAVRRYAVRWELRRTEAEWRAVAVHGEPRGLAVC